MFENDLLELQYRFWESDQDRQLRIKKLWIDLKRKNAIGGDLGRTSEEQIQLNKQIVELIR